MIQIPSTTSPTEAYVGMIKNSKLSLLIGCSVFSLAGFVGNNVLARMAAEDTQIDPLTYSAIRLAAGTIGAFVIAVYVAKKPLLLNIRFDVVSGICLAVYAIPFAFAYKFVGGGVGATILFVVAQLVIIGVGYCNDERPTLGQWSAISVAMLGFIAMAIRSILRNQRLDDLTMVIAGIAWGLYVVRGKLKETKGQNLSFATSTANTVGNFIVATTLTGFAWCLLKITGTIPAIPIRYDAWGAILAVISGLICSGIAYSVWYVVVHEVPYMTSGAIQLATPFFVTVSLAYRATPESWQVVFGVTALAGMATYMWIENKKRRNKNNSSAGVERDRSTSTERLD